MDISEQLSAVDSLIKTGETAAAKKKLLSIPKKKVPRQKLATFCQLFRRLRISIVPLQLLNPIVRATKGISLKPTADEKMEYAISLIDVGSPEEALSILQTIDASQAPRALLSQAFAHFSLWNYRASLPLLNRYLEHSSLTDYERLIGNVNLLGALVHEKKAMADALIPDLLKQTEGKFNRLHGNVLLFAAEKAIGDKNWKGAGDYLKRSLKVFGGTDSHEQVWVQKWEAVMEASQRKSNKAKCFEKVRKNATRLGHWETIRECDRLEAILERNDDLFLKVYFGTPWEHYREWLCRDFGGNLQIPEKYFREIEGERGKQGAEYNFLSDEQLQEQPLLLRLIAILNRDFYQPMRIASIHTLLYPDEFFNPFSSPNRIHQAVDRLKVWLKRKKSPLKVVQEEGGYKLTSTSSCKIVVQKSLPAVKKPQDLLQDLLKLYPKGSLFSVEEACGKLEVSSRTLRRFLQSAVKAGTIIREGKRRGARYRG